MSAKSGKQIRRQSGQVLALLALSAAAPRAWGQYMPPSAAEPKWFDLSLTQAYLKLDAEAEADSLTAANTAPVKNQTLYLSPTLGMGFRGSVYHPDLLNYSLLLEPGYSWQQQGTPGTAMSQTSDYVVNGNGTFTFLQAKPYSTAFNFDRSHDIIDYDFFNSEIVDQQSWGVNTGYREGPVPFSLAFSQSSQQSSGLALDSHLDQVNVNAHAHNDRNHGDATDFTYQFGQYDQTTTATADSYQTTSSFNYATLTDSERFRRSELNSSVTFNQYNANGDDSASLNGSLDYSLDLSPNLRNFYDYNLTTDSGGGADYQQHYFRAGVQHQLYQSLNSTFDVHGAWTDSSSPGADLQSLTEGTTLAENYSKRVGTWGHLSLGATASYDRTGQNSSGSELQVQNEAHTLATGQWVPLSQPNITAITSVTTAPAQGSRPLTEGMDYYVNRSVNPWLIEISPASLIITSGATVEVTYDVQPNPSGDYAALSDMFQLRLDLFDNLVGLYAHYDGTRNSASSPDFVLENVSEFQVGGDFHWRRLRLDANFTDRHSSLNNYDCFAVSEGYTLLATAHDSASLDMHQQWSAYPNAAGSGGTNQSQSQTYYSFTAHYVWHPDPRLNWSNEAGWEHQRGYGVDENLFVLRSRVSWHIGKLDLSLGYEYQDQDYSNETRARNFMFLKMKRDF